jgi:hypothetical protein
MKVKIYSCSLGDEINSSFASTLRDRLTAIASTLRERLRRMRETLIPIIYVKALKKAKAR